MTDQPAAPQPASNGSLHRRPRRALRGPSLILLGALASLTSGMIMALTCGNAPLTEQGKQGFSKAATLAFGDSTRDFVQAASRSEVRRPISTTSAPRAGRVHHERASSQPTSAREPSRLTGMALAVATCESGDGHGTVSWAAVNPSGASGAFQFMPGTWTSVTGLAPPASAYPPGVQIRAFWTLWANGAGARNWAASRPCWG